MNTIRALVTSVFAATLMLASVASAAGPKIFVNEFKVSGAPDKEDLRTGLPTLLSSRLNGEAASAAAGANVVVSGAYIAFGKVFSIDTAARDAAGTVIARAFVQGENRDDLIPLVAALAEKLNAALAGKKFTAAPAAALSVPTAASTAMVQASADSEIVRPVQTPQDRLGSSVSQRLPGASRGIVQVGEQGGEPLYVVAGKKSLQLYKGRGNGMAMLRELSFAANDTVLSIDAADLDGNGVPEVYVTILSGDSLSSQVVEVRDNAFKKLADHLPYYFRALTSDGGKAKIYAQQKGVDEPFFGDIYELKKAAAGYEIVNPFKLPKGAFIYNFNRFADAQGKPLVVFINRDSYLVVVSAAGEEIWRSNEKFGGSDLYYKIENSSYGANNVETDKQWVFLEQRIITTPGGEIIVPQNDGLFVVGYNRSYRKNSVFCFTWNGSSLEEKWHTRLSQNYLADIGYEPEKKELLLLEVTQKEGLFGSGASTIAVKRTE